MPTYILLTKLAPSASEQLKERDRTSHEWYKKVKKACPDVKFKAHYALLGQYAPRLVDFDDFSPSFRYFI